MRMIKLKKNNMKNIMLKISIIMLLLTWIFINNYVQATEMSEKLKEINIEEIEDIKKIEDIENITNEDILEIYDKVTEQYSNEEIANIILENQETISKEADVSKEVISAGANFIRNTDKDVIRDIISDEENINKIKESIQQGKSAGDAIASIVEDTTISQKIELFIKILLANKIIKIIFWSIIILFIYCTITRCVIYKKAGKNWIAGIIPLYRQITMYKICGLSPFLMILWFIPIIGWIAMIIISIMKRILLAQNFGKGGFFGFGILILPPIFYSIIAFNSNIQYEIDE